MKEYTKQNGCNGLNTNRNDTEIYKDQTISVKSMHVALRAEEGCYEAQPGGSPLIDPAGDLHLHGNRSVWKPLVTIVESRLIRVTHTILQVLIGRLTLIVTCLLPIPAMSFISLILTLLLQICFLETLRAYIFSNIYQCILFNITCIFCGLSSTRLYRSIDFWAVTNV